MGPSSQRERLINLALSAGSITMVLALFLASDWLYSRSQRTDPFASKTLNNNGVKLYRSDPGTGWYELNPNFEGQDRFGKLIFNVHTDSRGFRDPGSGPGSGQQAHQTPLSASAPAVLLLGDSFTYGVGLEWPDTFAAQLAARYHGPVINAGVNSHSPTPHLWRLRRWLQQGSLARDTVIVMAVDISDVFDEATRWRDGPTTPIDRSTAGQQKASDSALQTGLPWFRPSTFILTHQIYFGLEALVKGVIDNLQVRNNNKSAFTYQHWDQINTNFAPLGVKGGLKRLGDKIEQAARLSQANGHRFYLLIYPWPAQLAYANRFSWEQAIGRSCHKPDCSGVINTFPAFRQEVSSDRRWQDHLYIRGDMHFQASGNAIIAAQILKTLQANQPTQPAR